MNHVCIILDGNSKPGTVSWSDRLAVLIQPKAQSIQFIPRSCSNVPKVLHQVSRWRQQAVEEQRTYFNAVRHLATPQALISVVAHGFDVYTVLELLPDFKFYNLVFLNGTAPETFDWSEYELNFNRVLNYWSPIDLMVKSNFNRIGRIGQQGHVNRHVRVEGVRTRWDHDTFKDNLHNLSSDWTNKGGIFNR